MSMLLEGKSTTDTRGALIHQSHSHSTTDSDRFCGGMTRRSGDSGPGLTILGVKEKTTSSGFY
jgi:hypothetical protein